MAYGQFLESSLSIRDEVCSIFDKTITFYVVV